MIPVGTRDRRLLAFGIESQHLQCLRLHAACTRRLLPAVLLQSAASFVQWPEIHTALQVPAVSDVRSQHWMRVVGGEVEDGFAASARSLATAFYDHGVPGYAVAICHSAVTSGIAATLTSAPIRSWPFGRGSGDFKGVPLLAEALGKVAWLDLEVLLETYAEVEKARRESAQRQIKHFQHRIQSVAKTVGSCATSVEQNAKTLSWSVHQTSQKATDARDASVEASENVRSVVGAAEHLSATIGEVAQQVTLAANVAVQANSSAKAAESRIHSLRDSAERIGRVVVLIEAIASQTNLLALNATIEAARAGDAGKSFAVVANEVKVLATQTARATREFADQISAIQSTTREVVSAVAEIGTVIGEMDGISGAIAISVEQQRSATLGIADHVGRVASNARQVADDIGSVSDAAVQSGSAASGMLGIASDLAGQAAQLDQAVSELLAQSQAA